MVDPTFARSAARAATVDMRRGIVNGIENGNRFLIVSDFAPGFTRRFTHPIPTDTRAPNRAPNPTEPDRKPGPKP